MDRYVKAFPQLLVSEANVEAHLSTVAPTEGLRYVPKAIVGYGAYATVLKIERAGGGEVCCLKVMESHDAKQHQNALHMLSREARLTNASSSFATMKIVGIYEGLYLPPELLNALPPATAGTPSASTAANAAATGAYFCGCLMEYFEGGTMNQEISARRRKRLPLGEAQAGFLFLQVALALAEAHSSGVMHRDVKPSNVFMRASGLVCVADFGLASDNPRSTTLCGTPFYIAPEMWAQRQYDCKVDVWSLGVMLYELLTFSRPYVPLDPAARTNEDIKSVILTGLPPLPLPESVSEPFRALVAALLSHDPASRPSCEQVLQFPVCKALIVLFLRAVRVQRIDAGMEAQIVELCLKYLRPSKQLFTGSRTQSGSVGLSASDSEANGIARLQQLPLAPQPVLPEKQRASTFRTAASVSFGGWYRTTVTLDYGGETLLITADDTTTEPLLFRLKNLVAAFPCTYSTLTANHEGIVVVVTNAALVIRVQFVTAEEAQFFSSAVEQLIVR